MRRACWALGQKADRSRLAGELHLDGHLWGGHLPLERVGAALVRVDVVPAWVDVVLARADVVPA